MHCEIFGRAQHLPKMQHCDPSELPHELHQVRNTCHWTFRAINRIIMQTAILLGVCLNGHATCIYKDINIIQQLPYEFH